MYIAAHLYNNPLYENKSMSETIVHITNCNATFMGCINVFTKQFLSTIIASMCFWGLNCIRHPPRHIVLDFYTTPNTSLMVTDQGDAICPDQSIP